MMFGMLMSLMIIGPALQEPPTCDFWMRDSKVYQEHELELNTAYQCWRYLDTNEDSDGDD